MRDQLAAFDMEAESWEQVMFMLKEIEDVLAELYR
jgi:hypothetical protein